MPSAIITCELCNQPTRKDRYGQHVKVKHVAELATRFLQDATLPMFNPIKSFMRGADPKHYPIYSHVEEGAVWYFGVRPTYFRSAESYGNYIANEANMAEHKRFIEQVIRSINLVDYHNRTKGTASTVDANYARLHKIIEEREREIEGLKERVLV